MSSASFLHRRRDFVVPELIYGEFQQLGRLFYELDLSWTILDTFLLLLRTSRASHEYVNVMGLQNVSTRKILLS